MQPTIPQDQVEAAHHSDNQHRFVALEEAVVDNTELTLQLRTELKALSNESKVIAEDTRELLDLFRAAKGGLKVVGWLGTFAKWLAGLLAAFAALYAFVQNLKGH